MALDLQAGRKMLLNKFAKFNSFLLALLLVTIIGATLIATDIRLIGDLLRDPEFGRAVLFSLQTSIIATLLAAVTAVPAGLYLARNRSVVTRFIDALFRHWLWGYSCSPFLILSLSKPCMILSLPHREQSLPSFL